MTASNFNIAQGFLPVCSNELQTFELQSDLTFLEIAAQFAHLEGTVILASGGELDCARYNILGVHPWLTFKSSLTHATIDTCGRSESFEADPLQVLKYLLEFYKLNKSDFRLPLCAGFMGYLSYDLKDCIEVLPRTSVDDLHLPHVLMVAPSVILVEDRFEHTKTVFVSTVAGDAAARKDAFLECVSKPVHSLDSRSSSSCSEMKSCFTHSEYVKAIEDIRDYIVRGHVYQVNMSQRFESTFNGNPFSLFLSLFEKNPAPFYAFIHAGDHHIVSTSPERFIELRGRNVETRPIKGTRPRGKTLEDDVKNREDLEKSTKDDAELAMIVDLLRNDIGKVCCGGSVKVRQHKRVEVYENVFHLVSTIDGVLEVDKDAIDLIYATFPGGSITGCPKIRSMEIIDELEPVRRHIYTGSIGYISFHDTMDLSIAIRTATIKDEKIVFSVGGGIVYDSRPDDEYQETLHKGETLMGAISPSSDQIRPAPAYAWCNGTLKKIDDISVPVTDEGFLYGYGIFETIRVSNGVPMHLSSHLERFNKSWNYCFGTAHPDVTWEIIIDQVIQRNGLSNDIAAVKVLAALGKTGSTGVPTLLVTARKYTHRLLSAGRDGLRLATYPEKRLSILASHKTMNYMFYKMANDWAKRQGSDEAIILNPDGSVSETATANIFCIIDGEWVRPDSQHVLPGIMQNAVCNLLLSRGVKVHSRPLTLEELKNADHIFLTNALMGIVPVIGIGAENRYACDSQLCADINSAIGLVG